MKGPLSAVFGDALAMAPNATAGAQVWTPTFQAPLTGNDVGLHPTIGVGLEAVIRRGGFGVRGGPAGGAYIAGADFRKRLRVRAEPLAVALTLGGQSVFNSNPAFGGQVGLSVGTRIVWRRVTPTPYIHPRVAAPYNGGDLDPGLRADMRADSTSSATSRSGSDSS